MTSFSSLAESFAQPSHRTVISQDEQAVLAAAHHLIDAFGRHDTPAYFEAFSPAATFIFHTTPETLGDQASYERLWAEWERELGLRVVSCESAEQSVQLFGDMAVFRHRVRTTLDTHAGAVALHERESIVFQRTEGGRWWAVHEHLSPMPRVEGPEA